MILLWVEFDLLSLKYMRHRQYPHIKGYLVCNSLWLRGTSKLIHFVLKITTLKYLQAITSSSSERSLSQNFSNTVPSVDTWAQIIFWDMRGYVLWDIFQCHSLCLLYGSNTLCTTFSGCVLGESLPLLPYQLICRHNEFMCSSSTFVGDPR